MRHTDILIIGQGIAGTLLSYELLRAGKSVLIIDQPTHHKASLVASAVINPLIGKTWTIAKDADTLIPAALDTYSRLELLLHVPLVAQKSLLVFHQNKEAEAVFQQQIQANNPYTYRITETENAHLALQWNNVQKTGKVKPVYTVDAALLLQRWKAHLQNSSSFLEDHFAINQLSVHKGKLMFKDICAEKIVFCEGAAGRDNPFFPGQAFTTNRGEVLLLSIPGLSQEFLYQNGLRLVPKSDGSFWYGSNYTWRYENLQPDLSWQQKTLAELRSRLKLPFELLDHQLAERPTTAGQIPILAQHPEYPYMFCFNGLGTRGFSAGPRLAQQMAAMVLS